MAKGQLVIYKKPAASATPKKQKKAKSNGSVVRYQSPVLGGGGTSLAAVSYTQSLPTTRPVFGGGTNCVRIKHREFIADLSTTTAFSSYTGAINPGISGLFPWLSRLAPMFEAYSFRSLKFHIVPMCSSATAGQIFMAIDYDASDDAPSSKTEMLSYAGAVPMGLWQPFSMTATGRDESTLGKRRFVRPGDVPANTDVKTYDVGNLFVGSAGASGTATTSSLFVEYDIELFTPQFSISALASAQSKKISASTGVSKTALFGTAPTTLGDLAVAALNNTLTFTKVGQYLVELLPQGTGITDALAVTLGGTATSTTTIGVLANAGATAGSYEAIVEVTEPGQTVTFDWSAATTVASVVARIAQYAYNNL